MSIFKRKNLSYFLFRLIIFLSYFIFNQTHAANIVNYSLLLGENSSTVMYIFRFDDNSKGALLVEYGGSNSFKNAHTLGQNYGNSYIMPPKYGDNNKQETWTRLEYKLKNFQYNYEVRGNDQILGLASKESMQLIERYISNYESFSFSSKNNNNFYKENQNSIDYQVISFSLNNLISNKLVENPDLIKIDVDGNELEILEGFESLRNIKNISLIIETRKETEEEVYQKLVMLGFKKISRRKDNTVWKK